ncbi:CotY/CotZ family spore coat protein [Metabacillus sp. RGM 3146]|uniref:CotY/CotZ family spore coat protein n=1 Tax=Metabacillus sp. RGM 3146 TaxID=3401092 RepID=UPI003B99965B
MGRHSLLHRLKQIHTVQGSIEEPDPIQKLFITEKIKDTIPLLFYLTNGQVFQSTGNIGRQKGSSNFTTPFFRLEEINEPAFVTLSLLMPHYDHLFPTDIYDVSKLKKTACWIEMNTKVFGGVQYLDSHLVV